MQLLVLMALAAPGDYRDWINAAKVPDYFNPAFAAPTFATFKQKARDAKRAAVENASSYADFSPVLNENGFLLLDKFAKDGSAALEDAGAARDVIGALGAMTAKEVVQKTKYNLMNAEKPTWNKMAAEKARDVLGTVAKALMQGKPNGTTVEIVSDNLDMTVQRKKKSHVIGTYLGKAGGGRFRIPAVAALPHDVDIVIHTYKDGAGAWAHGDGQVDVYSPVVGLLVRHLNGTKVVVQGLSEAVSIRLPNTTSATPGVCAWWKQEDATWSTSGCARGTAADTDTEGVECLCTHLTEFALVGNAVAVSATTTLAPAEDDDTVSDGVLAGAAAGTVALTFAGVAYYR